MRAALATTTRSLWLIPVLFVLLALVESGAGQAAAHHNDDPLANARQLEAAFETVTEQVAPSVVAIRVKRHSLAFHSNDADDENLTDAPLVGVNGTGMILDDHGRILTNEHVIRGAVEVHVIFSDGQRTPAEIRATDTRADLAILQADIAERAPVRIADPQTVRRGQWVIAIGNPYGLGRDGSTCVSVGVVSNLNRRLPGLGEADDRLYHDMLQTTTTIYPGSSGGPLFNLRGEVVGMVTAMHTRSNADDGIAFAIPLSDARQQIIAQLQQGDLIDYGYIGMTVRALSAQEQRAFDLAQRGVLVESVEPNGPAAAAGIQPGDVVLQAAGQSIDTPGGLMQVVSRTAIGEQLGLVVLRSGREVSLASKIERRDLSRVRWMRGDALLWRGLRLANLTPVGRDRLQLNSSVSGVVVLAVTADSPAARAGFEVGDVLTTIAGQPVDGLATLRRLTRAESGRITVQTHRGPERQLEP